METKLDLDNFKDLMKLATDLTEKSKNAAPVFANVPTKLRNFASKTLSALDVKAKVSIDNLRDMINTRNSNPWKLDDKEENLDKNIPNVINWIITMLKNVLEKLNEQGEIIRVHTDALADPKAAIIDPKEEEIDGLRKQVKELTEEIDETRQRGMKGNIIVCSPVRGSIPSPYSAECCSRGQHHSH